MMQIGETLFLDVLKSNQTKVKYHCKIEEIDQERLYVTYPSNLRTNKSEFFMVGTKFHASFTTKDKSTYAFETELVDRMKQRIPVLVLSFPGVEGLKKIQRREYVRVDSAVDIAVQYPSSSLPPFNTITTDISAGGCAITLPENHNIEANMKVICWLVLPLKEQIRYIKQVATVIRVIKGEDGMRDRAPLQFMDVSEMDKQNILRYCFEEQLKFKKNGLL